VGAGWAARRSASSTDGRRFRPKLAPEYLGAIASPLPAALVLQMRAIIAATRRADAGSA
jgi:hypothetical protein